ncbi:MAG: hypothetical protein ACREP3_00035, partial [Candidatus Binatia bacterium]
PVQGGPFPERSFFDGYQSEKSFPSLPPRDDNLRFIPRGAETEESRFRDNSKDARCRRLSRELSYL